MNASNEILTRVKNATVELLANRNAAPTNLYIENNVLSAGSLINAQHQQITMPENTLMVFADEAPRFNWGHDCRYLLYTADNGALYKEEPAQFPPYLVNPPESFELFHEMVPSPSEPLPWRPPYKPPILRRVPWGKRYAVLFSGASNNRHTNDLEFLYRTLIDRYAFLPENIYVLNFDGTLNYSGNPHPVVTWPGNNTPYRMPVRGKGTRTDLDAVLADLKKRLQAPDLLLIHTNNHGGRSAESYLCTYSGPGYGAADFAAKLATLPTIANLMVMMEQCFSGGFVSPILASSTAQNTSVATACNATSSSIGGANFDPFARDWISAMRGQTPSGGALSLDPDVDHDAKVTAQEAFNYAITVKDPYDTPVYNHSSANAGLCNLFQRYIYIPWLPAAVAEVLKPYETKLPPDIFYTKVYHELGPSLEAIEAEIESKDNQLRDAMLPRVREVIGEIMEG